MNMLLKCKTVTLGHINVQLTLCLRHGTLYVQCLGLALSKGPTE
jgi:hypothetical protein